MEILKLIASFSTPIIILLIGFFINRNLENRKNILVKEKEWQIRWAELFLEQAIAFNEKSSEIICSLSSLTWPHIANDEDKKTQIINNVFENFTVLSEIEWHIQNYIQFANKSKDDVAKFQQEIMEKLRLLLKNKSGNLEEIREIQFEYNKSIRNAHNEILNSGINMTLSNNVA